jgi:hypothetical protein
VSEFYTALFAPHYRQEAHRAIQVVCNQRKLMRISPRLVENYLCRETAVVNVIESATEQHRSRTPAREREANCMSPYLLENIPTSHAEHAIRINQMTTHEPLHSGASAESTQVNNTTR